MEPPEYDEGREAHLDGIPVIDNPYPHGSRQADAWDRGWFKAQEEDD